LGLALAAPTTTWADPPQLCPNCQAQQQAYQQQAIDPAYQQQAADPANPQQAQQAQKSGWFWNHKHTYRSVRMCANCMRAQQAANGGAPLTGPPMVVAAHPGCPGCQAQAAATGYPVMGAPQPGFAVAGGSGEPVPVGVMQAAYSPANGAPGHAVAGGQPAFDPSTLPTAPSLAGPEQTHRRPHILLHLFGMRTPDSVWEEQRQREKAAHAAIAYGPQNPGSVTELPASVVYHP
jgi:hypothetical protein